MRNLLPTESPTVVHKTLKKLTSKVTKQSVCYIRAVNVVLFSFRITDSELLKRALEITVNSPLEGTNKHLNIILHVFNKKLKRADYYKYSKFK